MKLLRVSLFLLLVSFSLSLFAQTDSCRLRISLLTCSPGEELYSTFGHTAIRVTDSARGSDIVYNYGTFDDRDPNFYTKFTKGIMLYALSSYSFQEFLQEYTSEKRGVIEQVLALTCAEKQNLYNALQQNALEQNRYYYYYFHNDNCTTRARDMVAQKTGASVVFKNILPADHPTYRQLIHTYLDKGGQYWSKLGIDICLGSTFDKKVTNEQSMFLPDYLMKGFDSATANNHPLVSQKQVVLPVATVEQTSPWFTPVVFFSALLVIVILLSFSKSMWAQRTLNVFDCIFFLFVGLFGVLIVTLWAIRVDTVCRNNFNVLWALPTHLPIAFVVYLKRKWIRQYFRIVLILAALLILFRLFIPQQFNIAVVPILGIIIVRSYFRS
jgi:hypothetical protein